MGRSFSIVSLRSFTLPSSLSALFFAGTLLHCAVADLTAPPSRFPFSLPSSFPPPQPHRVVTTSSVSMFTSCSSSSRDPGCRFLIPPCLLGIRDFVPAVVAVVTGVFSRPPTTASSWHRPLPLLYCFASCLASCLASALAPLPSLCRRCCPH
ncbi:hypothetical protein PIB30_048477 [Stylosanthes scabra]|uniref:Secreted protein n=1 Tax=Stylosanthes scabra TaxID=79078 RepID=A0ABU6QGE3_9FABA|nr:hypothetical protein [Stylosanthes scabra]